MGSSLPAGDQPAQQVFPVELQGESWTGSEKRMEGEGGREERKLHFLHSPSPLPPPPPPPSFLFFALVPIFSTNSRGTACYAGQLGISLRWSDREKFFLWPYKKSFIIDPLVGQYCWILAKFLFFFFFFVFMNRYEFIRSIKTEKKT